ASLFDFGLAFLGGARYFYLPKLESHLEARLWAQAFALAEDAVGISRGSIRCTVLIETILAAFEMDEILYELRDYGCALNAGRWDYMFSVIKKLHAVLPDRAQVTMTVPFMRAYAELLVATCHKREAHAIGGVAERRRSGGDRQPDGGRGDGGDLALADLELGARRRSLRRGPRPRGDRSDRGRRRGQGGLHAGGAGTGVRGVPDPSGIRSSA